MYAVYFADPVETSLWAVWPEQHAKLDFCPRPARKETNVPLPGREAKSLMYNRNHYFGLGLIPKPKPKLVDTFGQYRNRYQNYILKGESSYR